PTRYQRDPAGVQCHSPWTLFAAPASAGGRWYEISEGCPAGWYHWGVARAQWLPQPGDGPGIVLAFAVAGAALALTAALPPSPLPSGILVALVLGALVLNTPIRRVIGPALPGVEREPDRYAGGLRYVGKWVLRLAIVVMGLKVQTSFFGAAEL